MATRNITTAGGAGGYGQSSSGGSGSGGLTSRQSMMASSGSAVKARQLAQLHSQLSQLSANLADTENLMRMTSVQAEAMRGLGSWHGGLFMAASKVLGEESVQQQGGGQK